MTDSTFTAIEKQLHTDLLRRRPIEAADLLDEMDPLESAAVIRDQDPQTLAPIVEAMAPATWSILVKHLPEELIAKTLDVTAPARAAAHLRTLDDGLRGRLIAALESNQRADIELILAYTPGTAGAVMDPRVIYLRPEMAVGDALERLRSERHHRQSARARRVMFVVNTQRQLQGIVAIQDLALAEPQHPVGEYMQPVPTFVSLTATTEEIVDALEEHRLSSLPVVDAEGHLAGVVRYEELVTAAKEDATVDLQTMFGASRDEKALSKPLFAVSKRLPWLQINLLTAFLAASVVGFFESTIAAYTALAVLLPVVAGQSGNTGAQALAVVIRGLALREISTAHWRRAVMKEAMVGLINGVAVAATTAAAVFVWSRSLGLTLVIGISMVLSMVVAGVAGAGIPLMLTKLGQDPAQSSSIVLTTITDIAGFFSFLGIATLFITML